jgi:glucose dehydrogenase
MAVPQAPAVAEPRGIGGWLILPVIGTLVSPLIAAYAAFQDAVVLLNNSTLSTGLAAFIVVELLYNLALVIAWILAAVLLFSHKRSYPHLFVALLVITLIGTVLDLVVAGTVFDMTIDSNDIRSTVRSVVGLAIWGPYMHKSVRVKNTFVED